MKEILEFELPQGSTAYIEVDDGRPLGLQKAGGSEKARRSRKAGKFEKALLQVRPVAEVVINSFREVSHPAEVSLEFSLKFSAEIGAFLFASADTEATFKVSLKWKNQVGPSRGPAFDPPD